MPPSTALRASDRRASGPSTQTSPPPRIAPRDNEVARALHARYFGTMEAAYRRLGGIASGDEVVLMLRHCSNQPLSRLARWIAARDVVSFEWLGTIWLPLFQFDWAATCVRPDVTSVIEELADVFDDWELAAWFAIPNTWLRCRTPVDVLQLYPRAVREAARADRFIARG